MSKGSTKVDAPDPMAVAQADATYNRIDQYTPFGSLTYGGPERNQAFLEFNPALSAITQLTQDQALGRLQGLNQSLPEQTTGINFDSMNYLWGLPGQQQTQPNTPSGQQQTYDAKMGVNPQSGPAGGQPSPGAAPSGPYRQGDDPNSQYYDGDALSQFGLMGQIIDPSTFGQLGSLDQLEDFELDRGRVEQNYFDRTSSLLNPQYDQAQEALYQDLANRGIPRDSDAAQREIANFERNKGETFGRLANDSVLQGGGEQSRLFGLSSALGDRTSAAQQGLFGMLDQMSQRDIQAQLQNANVAQSNRATQFNELASLLGLSQVAAPQLNNFFAPGMADVTGAYGLQQNAFNQNANRSAGMKGGLLGGASDLGGAYISGK